MQRKIKRRNTQEITFFGLIWKKNKSDLGRSLLREDDVIRRSKDGQPSPMKPTCCLCFKPYCPDLMYIRCERCSDWFHGDALELKEAMIVEVLSYRCCRCRRRALPRCPHSDDYYCKRSEPEPISQGNAADILSSEEAVGTADEDPSYASFGRIEQTVEETINADFSINMETSVKGSNQEMNFADGSSHSAHPFAKEVRPYDACFPWYTHGSGTCRRLDPVDPVDDVPPPAATVETNFDKDQTVILHQAYDGFRVIAAETGSLYEQLRQGDHLTNDEIMGTLDKLQQTALHHMKDIACRQANGVAYPVAQTEPLHTASTSTIPSDHQSSSRTLAPDAVATASC